MAHDPVCGIYLTPEKAKVKQDYRGMTYYFCSEECRDRFRENPEAIRKEQVQYDTEGEVQTI
jgi:YHS domain-containing protein